MNVQVSNVHQTVSVPVHDLKIIIQVLRFILRTQERILATQAELANALNGLNSTVQAVSVELDKVAAESQTSLQKITDLENIINQGGNTSPEVDAALQAVKASIQSVADKVTNVDNLIPDAPVGPDTSSTQGQPNQSTATTSTP